GVERDRQHECEPWNGPQRRRCPHFGERTSVPGRWAARTRARHGCPAIGDHPTTPRQARTCALAASHRCARFSGKVLGSIRRSCALLGVIPPALVAGPAPAGPAGQDLPTLHSLQPPAFTADLAVAVDSTSRARVKAIVSVPYTELTWQRAGDGYTAGASFVVELVPDKGPRRLYGDSWEKRIMVPDYGTTTSHRN